MPINFEKLLENHNNKTGKCLIPYENYDYVESFRIDCNTKEKTQVKCFYIIEDGLDGKVFRILNGVTGYEAFYIKHFLAKPCNKFWAACCLTPGRWDGLLVDGQQVLEKIQNFG